MANNQSWNVILDGKQHIITLNWTYYGGTREVVVDGQMVDRSTEWLRPESKQHFVIDNHMCEIVTRPRQDDMFTFEIMLFIDGKKVD